VKRQRRRGQFEAVANVACWHSFRTASNQQPKNIQAALLSESTQSSDRLCLSHDFTDMDWSKPFQFLLHLIHTSRNMETSQRCGD
jgi:hypothetical protein